MIVALYALNLGSNVLQDTCDDSPVACGLVIGCVVYITDVRDCYHNSALAGRLIFPTADSFRLYRKELP